MVENSIDNEWDETIAQLDPAVEPSKVRVLDLIDISVPRADAEERARRMAICKGCDRLKLNTLCSECNCIMKFKTWLGPATCPIGKW
jgi:hypothetical protein